MPWYSIIILYIVIDIIVSEHRYITLITSLLILGIVNYSILKDFPKERYNTYAKSCNSNLYTKYPGATYSGLLLGTMSCL